MRETALNYVVIITEQIDTFDGEKRTVSKTGQLEAGELWTEAMWEQLFPKTQWGWLRVERTYTVSEDGQTMTSYLVFLWVKSSNFWVVTRKVREYRERGV